LEKIEEMLINGEEALGDFITSKTQEYKIINTTLKYTECNTASDTAQNSPSKWENNWRKV
jgi:hypothetical protein